jgi:uncharacterized protein with HEPN domain
LDEIAFLTRHVERLGFEDLLEDELLQRGVIRSLEIIGEASKNVSPEIKKAHPEIEWKMMAAMRDKLIHRYFQVNWRIVWNVLTMEIPPLKVQIEEILQESQPKSPSQDHHDSQ